MKDTLKAGVSMTLKIKRVENKKLLKSYRAKKCLACGAQRNVCAHHLKSKKSGGHDLPNNLIPLCDFCHTKGSHAVHRVGLDLFSKNFTKVEKYLINHGWENTWFGRWFLPKNKEFEE